MKISYNWLRDYLVCDLSVEALAEVLTDIGLEVDSLERVEAIEGGLEGVVVGHVLTCGDHPDSDHLHVTTVDVGADEPLGIVCGAHNVAAGQKVLVATVGTVLKPKGADESFKIKKSRIRGVESHGMICAEDELGLGDDHDGIMVLAQDAVVGTPAVRHLGLEGDWMIEIGLTPNRVDGASHIGVARDVAAYLRARGEAVKVEMPCVDAFEAGDSMPVAVEVQDHAGAPRYAGVTITNLRIGLSPEWMQNYLRAIGLNPHNNLVDITNFVLHEMGQPLHAFDADKIKGGKIVVRRAVEGDKFVTLDGVERTLSGEDLMICDAEGPMCIAGVMGGAESGVGGTTTRIFLESACFDPVSVRKTARRHGINSDASFLFERGVDPDITVYALKRAALLYKELAGGVCSGITDVYPEPFEPFRFEFSLSRANRLIGKEIPRQTVMEILAALDVVVEDFDHVGGDVLRVAVPRYRVDVQREVDLVEEVLRIYGYNNIELPTTMRSSLSPSPRPDKDKLQNLASEFLTSNGYTEIMSNSLTRAAYYEGLGACPAEKLVRIMNPLSTDLNVMRQTLLFNALEAVKLNTNHRAPDLKLYEFGNCYFYNSSLSSEGGGVSAHDGGDVLSRYGESYRLGIAVTGLDVQPSWNAKAQGASFFTLSGAVERLVNRFGFSTARMQMSATDNDLFSDCISYSLNGKHLVTMGVVSPAILSRMDIGAPVYFAEIDFGHLVRATAKTRVKAVELPRFPSVRRDLALVVGKDVTFRKLRDIAMGTEKKLLTGVTLFDVYEGDKIEAGKRSYAIGFTLCDRGATLTERTISAVMNNLVTQFEKVAGATVRA